MADTKVSALTGFTPVGTDVLYGVDDPGGTPVSGKFTVADLFGAAGIEMPAQTVTVSTPIVDTTQTWNDALVEFTALKVNVTDTASDADSKLLDLQVGGTTKFEVDKSGAVKSEGNGNALGAGEYGYVFRAGGQFYVYSNGAAVFTAGAAGLNILGGTHAVNFGNYCYLVRDDNYELSIRNATNPSAFKVYNTYTNSSNYERAFSKWNTNVWEIGTEAAGTGTQRGTSLVDAAIDMPNLPTSDPLVAGRLWNNSGVLTISAG